VRAVDSQRRTRGDADDYDPGSRFGNNAGVDAKPGVGGGSFLA
jgi:hypothetical protein